jgi:hypothetical protein
MMGSAARIELCVWTDFGKTVRQRVLNLCLWEQYPKEARERLTDGDKDFLMETAFNFYRKSYTPYPNEII